LLPSKMVSMETLSNKDIFTSRSSYHSTRADEGDSDDEIVFFGDDSENAEGVDSYNDDYDYDYYDNDKLPAGYKRSELEQRVTFVKSSKNADTGDFLQERKDLLWCLENSCEEAKAGVWSGAWYFTYLYGKKEGEKAWVDAKSKRLVKESDGKARKMDNVAFCAMLEEKTKGNRAFSRGQYKSAVNNYLKAEKFLGGAVIGVYLVAHQRAELVKVLSNQAECYLRMQKYEDAILQSTAALQLDKRHEKSLLRRAKATFHGAERHQALNSIVAAQAVEDLQAIIEMKGQGADEARAFKEEIEGKVKERKK
jgi:tetratricopeptide (TPR) repeat protein